MILGILAAAIRRITQGGDPNAVIPDAYLYASNYTGTTTTTFNADLPAGVGVGDFVIIQTTVNKADFTTTDDLSWMFLGSIYHVVDPSSATYDGTTRWYGKVIDGTEAGTIPFYTYNSTAAGWATLSLALRAGTYTIPRGYIITKSVFLEPFHTGGIGAGWTVPSSDARHSPHYAPYDDAEDTLLLSFLGSSSSNDYGTAPLTDFDYSTGITSSAGIPRVAVCGQVLRGSQELPFAISDWTKGNVNNRYATALMSIPTAAPPTKPRCIFMSMRTSGGSVSTTGDVFNNGGVAAAQEGDLQVVVMNVNGGSGNTITLSEEFDQVIKYGNRIVVYKRIFDPAIHTDHVTFTATSNLSYLHTMYTFPVGTYDPSGDVIAVAQTASTSTAVTCPAVVGDSSYDNLNNFVIQHIVREGNAASNDRGITTFPIDCKYVRNQTFNQGSTTGRVSYVSAGKHVFGSSSVAETYTFGSGSTGEVVSIMVKGIDGINEPLAYWDEAFSNTSYLTFDDSTITRNTGTDGTVAGARSIAASTNDTDLIYFEVQNIQGGAIANGMRVGVVTIDHTSNNTTPSTEGWSTGLYTYNWANNGDTIMVAVNRVTNKLWVGSNGTWTSSDPASNGTPYANFTFATEIRAYVQMSYGNQSGTLATKSSEFLYTPPDGFVGLGD